MSEGTQKQYEQTYLQQLPNDAKIGVIIALAVSGRLVPPELILALSCNQAPTHMNQAYLMVKGLPIEEAREVCAANAIKTEAKYLWFVDDDTIPPPNALRRLIYVLDNYPDVGIVGGVYVTKSTPPQPVVFRGMGHGSFWHWKKGEVFEVTGMGAGCMLINTKVFKDIKPPYFPWPKVDSEDPTVPSWSVSEDISFCNKVREAGYRVVAHGGILCDHFDTNTKKVYTLPADSYPMRDDVYIFSDGTVKTTVPETAPQEKGKIDGTSDNHS